jgi:hypothetical protein
VKRYGLTLKPSATAAGDVHFPTDDLQLVLAQRDPLLTFTWQHLMVAAAQGRIGPFTAREFFEAEMGGDSNMRPPTGSPRATPHSVQEDLDKLARLGIVAIDFLN